MVDSEDEAKKSMAKLVYKSRSRRNNVLGKIRQNDLLSWGLNVWAGQVTIMVSRRLGVGAWQMAETLWKKESS